MRELCSASAAKDGLVSPSSGLRGGHGSAAVQPFPERSPRHHNGGAGDESEGGRSNCGGQLTRSHTGR
ncbi:MAG: hypothetical protein QOK14_1841, partial [Frankiaceae bacterium]|nr:hypothetical protein [Frankiaceae bacterium]